MSSIFQVIYLLGFGVPLFIDNTEHSHRVKWGLWVIHRLVLTAIYGTILFMYNSKWRERLPGKLILDIHIFTRIGLISTCSFVLVSFNPVSSFLFNSKTCILQVRRNYVHLECTVSTCLCAHWKWDSIWLLVNPDLRKELYSQLVYNIVSIKFPFPSSGLRRQLICRLYGATIVCYHAFYLPLLYITFLADFFQVKSFGGVFRSSLVVANCFKFLFSKFIFFIHHDAYHLSKTKTRSKFAKWVLN